MMNMMKKKWRLAKASRNLVVKWLKGNRRAYNNKRKSVLCPIMPHHHRANPRLSSSYPSFTFYLSLSSPGWSSLWLSSPLTALVFLTGRRANSSDSWASSRQWFKACMWESMPSGTLQRSKLLFKECCVVLLGCLWLGFWGTPSRCCTRASRSSRSRAGQQSIQWLLLPVWQPLPLVPWVTSLEFSGVMVS